VLQYGMLSMRVLQYGMLSICAMPHLDGANARVNGMVSMCGMPRAWYAIDTAYASLHCLFAASFLASFTLSIHLCVYVYARMNTYMYIHTYVCIHMYVCMCVYQYVHTGGSLAI